MNPDPNALTDLPDSEQCMLYLAGDLSEASSSDFEQRLLRSPELAAELSNQSELLCLTAMNLAADQSGNAVSVASVTLPATVASHQPWIIALLTLAASLLIVASFWLLPDRSTSQPMVQETSVAESLLHEEELFAAAWATTDAEILFLDIDDDNDDDTDVFSGRTLDDSSLSWISVAIESEASLDG
ncbi:hypothetical protein [Planctomycetes bacterium K23_9]|uniref:Uncharacterized protein n=1 Tax=Stieleria marina TaxID=1930275 RepID=A0A517NNP6_9BACT|nr:hypothetical protein K239x_06970 [Planctomycetes bacterium K23_9]